MIGCMCVVGGVTNKLTTLQCWSLRGTDCVTELVPCLNFFRWPSQRMARLLWPSKMPKVTMQESTSVWAETSLVEYPTEWDFSWEVGRIFFLLSTIIKCFVIMCKQSCFSRSHSLLQKASVHVLIVSHSTNWNCFPFWKSEMLPIPQIGIVSNSRNQNYAFIGKLVV